MPKGPGVADQVPTRASAGEVPPMLKGMPKHVLSAAMDGISAAEQAGFPVSISRYGGFRTAAMQKALFSNRSQNPNPVAAPGESQHEHGLAIDIASGGGLSQQRKLAKVLEPHGWKWAGAIDPVHFDYVGTPNGAGDAPMPTSLPGMEPPTPKPRPRTTAPVGGIPATLPGLSAPGVSFTPDVPASVRNYPWHQLGGLRVTDVTPRAFRTADKQIHQYQMVNGHPQVIDPSTGQPIPIRPTGPPQRTMPVGGAPRHVSIPYSEPEPRHASVLPAGAIYPSERTDPRSIQEATGQAAGAYMQLPQKIDNVAWAAASVAAKHLKEKGGLALGDPEMWNEMNDEMGRAVRAQGGTVHPNVVQRFTGADPGQGWKAAPAFLADAALEFFYSPSNDLAGPLAEHTIVPAAKAIGRAAEPLIGKVGAKIAERAPELATAAEKAAGALRVGKAGKAAKAVERSLIETKARMQHESTKLATQIRYAASELRREPAFEAADNAFRRESGGKSRLQDAIDTYVHTPKLGLTVAKEHGIDPEMVKHFGDQIIEQADNLMTSLKLHGMSLTEKSNFRRGYFHRLSGLTPEQGFGPHAGAPAETPRAAPPTAPPPAPPTSLPGTTPPPASPATPPAAPTTPATTPAATAPPARPAGPPRGLGVTPGKSLEELAGPREAVVPPPPIETVKPGPRIHRLTTGEAKPKAEAKPAAGAPSKAEVEGIFGPQPERPTAKPSTKPVVRERGEIPKPAVPIDAARTDVPAETQRLIARLTGTPGREEAARRLAKKWGVTPEDAAKWAESLKAPAAKMKRARPGFISLFADSANRAGAPKNIANVMAVAEPAGSKEGRQAIENLGRQHGLEAAAQTGMVKDLKPGETPQRGWVQVPDKPAYGALAGKQVPRVLGDVVRSIAERPFSSGVTDELEAIGKKTLRLISKSARLAMLHPVSNPIGLATSTGDRVIQIELGARMAEREASAGKGVLRGIGEAITGPVKSGASVFPSGVASGKELGAWWRRGGESEAIKRLTELFPTWLQSYTGQDIGKRTGGFLGRLEAGLETPFMKSGAEAHARLDQWAKLTLFKMIRGKVGDEAAARIVKRVLFDYSDNYAILERANRDGWWVFNSVPTKQAGMALRTLIERPDLLARYPRLRNMFFASQPGSEEEYKNLPGYQQSYFTLPLPHKKGERQDFLNLSRWIPFSGFFDLLKPSGKEDKREPLDKLMSFPLWGPAAWALGMGRSTMTGQPLTKPGAPPGEDWRTRIKAVGEQALPTTVRAGERIQRANKGETPSSWMYAEPQTPAEAWAQAFGFPIYRGQPTKGEQTKTEANLDIRGRSSGNYGDELNRGYKKEQNPYRNREEIKNATIGDMPSLAGKVRNGQAYMRTVARAASSYDGKNNLTEEAKQKMRDTYNYVAAAGERWDELDKHGKR